MSTPSERQAGARVRAIESLACCLYERLEHLDPGVDEYVEWLDLLDRDRELYRFSIEGVFDREPAAVSELAKATAQQR